jgi:hypothetical protein
MHSSKAKGVSNGSVHIDVMPNLSLERTLAPLRSARPLTSNVGR